MPDRPDVPADLAGVLRALLADASPELFGTVPPAVAVSVSGELLEFPVRDHADLADTQRVVRTLAGSGQATVSLSGMAARVRRARDLTLALLTTDAERVVASARSTVHEGGYTTSQQLTALAVTAVDTQLAGDAATARITLHVEAAIELSRPPREGEATTLPSVPIAGDLAG
jgi:hypothetical protein